MNRYVVRDLKKYGDDFRLLKIWAFFPYFWEDKIRKSPYQSTQFSAYFKCFNNTCDINRWVPILDHACAANNLDLLSLAIQIGNIADRMDEYRHVLVWNACLKMACRRGYLRLVHLMILFGANRFNQGLYEACCCGHLEIIDLMIEKGADGWSMAVIGACIYGKNRKLVETMIEKATQSKEGWASDYAFEHVCFRGHQNIVDLFIELGVGDNISILNRGLGGACEGGHRDLVDLMIAKGANDWNRGLWMACDGGHPDLVDLMIQKGANDWSGGLNYACINDDQDLVDLMFQMGATRCPNCHLHADDHWVDYWDH